VILSVSFETDGAKEALKGHAEHSKGRVEGWWGEKGL
jgi:hypothetical protein